VGLLVLVVPGSAGLGPSDNSTPAEPSQLISMLVIGATFMGASISIRDLVGERQIFLRERSVGLPVSAYLSSKFLIFGMLAVFMAAMLTFVTFQAKTPPLESNFFGSPTFELFVALALTALVSMVSGLLISALVRSGEQVMPLFVVFLMAQLVLNGGLLQINDRGLISTLAVGVIARWGFAMTASTVNLGAISPSLDEDPLWEHSLYAWGTAASFLVGMLVIVITVTKLRLDGKYER
jgi:hypothetical protein